MAKVHGRREGLRGEVRGEGEEKQGAVMENDGKGGDGIGWKRMGMGRAEGRTKEGEGTAVGCVASYVI